MVVLKFSINPFQSSPAFRIETSHLICNFYMTYNGLTFEALHRKHFSLWSVLGDVLSCNSLLVI